MQNLFQELPASVLKASWQGAILILLVLTVQWTLGRRLHPRWRCALWLLVLVRLALPWTLPARTSLFNVLKLSALSVWSSPGQTGAAGLAAQVAPSAAGAASASPARSNAAPPRPWGRSTSRAFRWSLTAWAGGALALAGCLLLPHYRLTRRLALQRPLREPALDALLEDCKQKMGVRTPVRLVETNQVGSPSLFGFVRPRLLLPSGLARSFSPAELRYVFLHELAHVKRHDILLGWLMAGLQLLHWFNPLVWLAFGRLRAERELACDALALACLREEERPQYGHTIIKLLQSFGRSAWAPSLAGAVENQKQLKERIRMIAQFKPTRRGPVLALALLGGLGLITLTDAQPAASDLSKNLLGTWILVGQPGQVGQPPAAGGRLKSFTDSQWSITQADPKDGVVIFHHGGPYTLQGSEYVETIAFANETTRDKIGNTHKYKLTVEGDTLTQVGIGNPWSEVWKRVKPEAPKPRKLTPTELQGKWSGQEVGQSATCSLVISGSKLEFHGGDPNEWYKADLALYDTQPRQAVVSITDCPVPDFKGVAAYAIYKLQDGALTISGNQPGALAAPADFEAPHSRTFVFRKQ